ncbi:hypothetical protein JXQ70_10145 [bacterium]|nr:hypothetical protein [bacterium]
MTDQDSFFNKINRTTDQIIKTLIDDLLASEYFGPAVEKIVHAGGLIDEHIQTALHAVRVASKREVEDLEERLVRLEQKLERALSSIEEIKAHNQTGRTGTHGKTAAKTLRCPTCGREFSPKSSSQKFCSAACRSGSSPVQPDTTKQRT